MFAVPPDAGSTAALATAIAAITPLGPYTVATLPAPDASNLGRSATVTDLFGSRYSRVRCEQIGAFYFWQPLSSDSFGNLTMTGNVSLAPLATPQTNRVTGSLLAGVTRTITLDIAGGWPGCVKEFTGGASMGLGAGLNILGTGLGSGVALLLGGYRKFGLDYSGGTLTWVQLV